MLLTTSTASSNNTFMGSLFESAPNTVMRAIITTSLPTLQKILL
jgi:hypothetical protein